MIFFDLLPTGIFVILLWTQIVGPLWRGQRTFPLVRYLAGKGVKTVRQKVGASELVDSSKQRLDEARVRLTAAQVDVEAAKLEIEADRREDEANRLRVGSKTAEDKN
jgi:hypothetical protein